MIEKIENFEQYKLLIAEYNLKGVATNNYLLPQDVIRYISDGFLHFVKTEHNLAILVDRGNCLRVYYHILDFEDQFDLSEERKYAIEILYRGSSCFPEKEVLFWETLGFHRNVIRDYYLGKIQDLVMQEVPEDVDVSIAKDISDVRFAVSLFNTSFDQYTGDYIQDTEIPEIVQKGSVSVARIDGQLVGACHAYEKNKVIYLGHLAVLDCYKGKKIGRVLMQEMINRLKSGENTRYSLWVQRENTAAVTLYQKLGYIYSNKSTISLLK